MVATLDLDNLPTIWCRDRYAWDDDWVAICEHETQSTLHPNAARDTIAYLRAPVNSDGSKNTAGIHYAVDASEVWRGTDPKSPTLGRSPHCYRPSHWSVGIEHVTFTVPGSYDNPGSQAMLRVSAQLHVALIDDWEARHPGRKFTLQVLDIDGLVAKETGLFTHDTATQACKAMGWDELGHYDGRYFPFPTLLDMIDEVRGTKPPAPPQEDDMPQVYTFFPPGSTPHEDGLQAFVEVEWATGQVHGWHGVTFTGADSDEALGGDLRTVDFVKLNAGKPIRDFRIDEDTGNIVGFGQGGGIFRITATAS